ncbi:tetratricopeptide repeat protein [Sorangium sp. So ce385]|uniref:tetratricopeptide repeat protein n=1 Tax=Sorangium sp. So ce385 TaxID=3133308 RepID=UPI003F5CB628
MTHVTRKLLSAAALAAALVHSAACVSTSAPTAARPKCAGSKLRVAPFTRLDATRVLVADLSVLKVDDAPIAAEASQQLALQLSRFAADPRPNRTRYQAVSPKPGIEVRQLPCVIADARAAINAAADTGAHVVLWGRLIRDIPVPVTINSDVRTGTIQVGANSTVRVGNIDANAAKTLHLLITATLRRSELDFGSADERIDLASLADLNLLTTQDGGLRGVVEFAAGLHHYARKEYWLAARHFERSAERILPDIYPETIDLAIGSAYLHLAMYQRSMKFFDRALSNTPDADKALRAALLNARGYARTSVGQHERALSDLSKALEITEELVGRSDPLYALRLNNRAFTLGVMGRSRDAEIMFNEALATLVAAHGRQHPRVAVVLNNMGVLDLTSARYDDAASKLNEALNIDREMLGQDHPNVAIRLYNLGSLALARDDSATARQLLLDAYKIDKRALGEHPFVARDASRIAELLAHEHEHAQAIEKLQEARRIYEALHDHESMAHVDERIGAACCDAGDAVLAEKWYRSARSYWASQLSDLDIFRLDEILKSLDCKQTE